MKGLLAGLAILAALSVTYYVGTWHVIRRDWPTWSEVSTTLGQAWTETMESRDADARTP